MRTLYRKFIVATLFILIISITIGFILANFMYMSSTKQKIDQQNVEIAETITLNLESMHSNHASLEPFLESIGNLGYQIYVLSESGEDAYFGKPFTKTELPQEAMTVVLRKKNLSWYE